MSAPLTTRIPIKDQHGNVVDEKEVATYAGLLSRAHEEGLKVIATALVQVPPDQNGHTAIASAVVETSKGKFAGIGDASPDNVNRKIAPHLIRMAETRAKARALRDAVNIGVVALEELAGDEGVDEAEVFPTGNTRPANVRPFRARPPGDAPLARAASHSAPSSGNGGNGHGFMPMTEPQRRLLFRILAENGYEGEQAKAVLLDTAGVANVRDVGKKQASEIIDAWRTAGISHAAP